MEDRSVTVIPGHEAMDPDAVETVATADVEPVTPGSEVAHVGPPEGIAEEINKQFLLAQMYGGRCDQARMRAGQYLIEARATIVGEGQWIAWCKANINRSRSDIKAVMRIASAPE